MNIEKHLPYYSHIPEFGNFIFRMSIVFAFIAICNYIQAQEIKMNTAIEARIAPKLTGTIYQKTNNYSGSEMLFPDWQKGEIILSDSSMIRNQKINYDAFSDNLIYTPGKDISVVVSKYQISSFKLGEANNIRVFDLILSPGGDYMYLESLYKGNLKLYAARKLKISSALLKANTFGESVYYQTNEYYLMKDGKLIPVASSKMSFYSLFDKALVKNIIHKNRINLKKEADLVRFIGLLDSPENMKAE